MLTDALTQVQNAQGQPLIPNEEGTPMNNLIRTLNLQAPAQAPAYDFELDEHVTLDQVMAQCTERNINLFDVTRNLGNRSFYDHNQTFGDPPAIGAPELNNPWREYSRPEAAEKAVEMSLVTCYADSHTVVNWDETMPKLKQLFKARIYTNDMAKACLMNIYTNDMAKACLMNMVHKYHPEQAILLRTRTANQIATHLLQLDSNRDKRTYHRMLLFKTVRTPEEDLPAALAKAQLIINAIYPPDDPAYAAHRSSTFRTALISFCHDTIAAGVLEKIQKHQAECLPLTDDDIRDFAVRYENYMHLKPTANLAFGRNINNTPAATFIQLNSMQTAANMIYPAYPAYPSPFANPYPAYPWYEDRIDNAVPPEVNPHQGPNGHGPNQGHQHQHQLINAPQNQLGIAAPANQLNPVANLQAQIQLQGIPPAAQQPRNPAENMVWPFLMPNRPQQPQIPPLWQWPPTPPVIPLPAPGERLPQTPATAVKPAEDGVQNSPFNDHELRSLTNDSFHTPESSWTPKRAMEFNELPTDARVFLQSQRRLANIGNEIVLVRNHPEDLAQRNLLEQFQSLALNSPKKPVEQGTKYPSKVPNQPPRRSSRERRKTDFYQAGLNSMIPTRGYVHSSGRYRSYSRDRAQPNGSQSRDREQYRANSYSRERGQQRHDSYRGFEPRPLSRNDSRTRLRSVSRDRSRTPEGYRREQSQVTRSQTDYRRNQSPSAARSKSPMYSSSTRPSRAPYKGSYRSADRSESTRRTYPLMQKGLNCRSDYDPQVMKNCKKCLKNGHHEFECAKYSQYSDSLCTFCGRMYHRSQDCKEIKNFPPGTSSKN